MNALLEVAGLTITDRRRTFVDSLSFTLDAGERMAVVGETGSGKSLVGLAVLGLLPRGLSTTGTITVEGSEVTRAGETELQGLRGATVTLVPQHPGFALDPLTRIGHQLAEPLRRHQHRRGLDLRTDLKISLAEVALQDIGRVARSFPHQLTDGQRQRVTLAMALACTPRLLIVDDPAVEPDGSSRLEFVTLLDELCRRRGLALVFLTPDLALASRVAGSILVMKDGQALEHGPTSEVLERPRHRYTRNLVRATYALEGALRTGELR